MENTNWVDFNQEDYKTYPPEGEDVLISGVDANTDMYDKIQVYNYFQTIVRHLSKFCLMIPLTRF